MLFSEDSRVKIPCLLHLVRLGYRYLSLKHAAWDTDTNIFPALFNEAIGRLNPDLSADDLTRLLADVKLLLDNEDLGKAFYERLTERSCIHPSRLNRFIEATDREVLQDAGKVTAEIAKAHAESEFENTASCRTDCLKVSLTGC